MEVGQRPIVETEWDTLTFDVLLAYAAHDLRYIEVGTFRACFHHVLNFVRCCQVFVSEVTCLVTSFVQCLVDVGLERLEHILSRLATKRALVRLVDDLAHLPFVNSESVADQLVCLRCRDCVFDTHSEAMLDKPSIDDILETREEVFGCLWATLSENDMVQAS